MYSLIINKKSYFQNFFSMGSLKKKTKKCKSEKHKEENENAYSPTTYL